MTNFKLAALLPFFAAILPAARAAEPWDAPFASDVTAIMKRAPEISADNEAGVQVLLEEHRISIDARGRARGTFRKVYRILKEDSVEDWSSVQESYQPWREQKPSIRARVITKTGSVHELDLKTIADSPEEQFDASTYSDTRVVRAPLPAVEPGAVVEFEIVTDSGPAFPEAGITERLQVIDEVPLEHFRIILEAPVGAPLQTLYRQIPDSAIHKTTSKGMTQIECDLGPFKARKKFEGSLPPDLSVFPYFAFSTAPSWQALAAQYAEIVERQIQSADVKALMGSIPSGASPLEVAGRLATELHRNVRYTGVEFGESAVVPARPAEVLQRKFGDCKDKSALLVAMLRAAGLKASVALLRSGFATDVDASLPGLDLFDHAIVYVDGPQPLWIDATANHARVGVLPEGDQGRLALIATKETTGLVKIPEQTNTLDRNQFEIRFKDYGPGTIIETMESNGPSEMRLRSAYAASDNAKAALERYVKAAYAAKSLGEFDLTGKDDLTQPVRVKVEARDTAQVTTTIESAQVLLSAGVLTSALPYELQPKARTADSTTKEAEKKRVNDYLFDQAGTRQHIYKLYAPALYRAASLPQSSEVNLGPLKLARSYKKDASGVVEVEYTLQIPKRRITGAEYNKLAEDLEKYEPQLSDRISFVPETAELLAVGQTSKALALMRENVAKNPNEAAAHMRLSRVLDSVGLGMPARSEAKRSTELEPNSSQAWQTLSWAWQNDSFGRLRRGDWNRAEALKALRKAVELDAEDQIAKADLAILLEFNDTGERYGTGSNLKASIGLYRELLKGPGSLGLETNLTAAVFYDMQLDAATDEARKCAESQRIVFEASIRALREGPGPAIVALQSAVVDPAARAQDLITLAFSFIHLRRYPDALVFAQAASRATSLPQAAGMVQLIGRFKRVEDVQFPDTDPRAVVQKFLAEVIGDAQLNRDKLRKLWVHIPDEGSSDEDVLSVRRTAIGSFQQLIELGFTTENFVDMTLSQYKLEREGDDEHGYRISPDITTVSLVSGRSSMGEMFVVRDGGSYKILDSADDLGEVGRKVLDLLKQNKIEAAQWWLDKSIPGMKSGADGWLPAARGLWSGTVAATRGPDTIQVTAAALIGRAQGSADAIAILNDAYPKAKNAIDKGQIDLALCEAYSKAKRWGDLLTVAKRLRTSKTFDSAGYQYLMKAFQAQKDWKGLEAAALDETKSKTGTPDAWQYVVIARMRMGNAAGAEEAIAKFKETAAGSQAVELEVWNQILQKKVTEATLETVHKQDGPKQIHDSYLVALVDLAMKKTEETQEALKQAVGNDDSESMDARGWVIYGGICDQYGFPDAAAAAWENARAAKSVTRESEWALATLGK